VWVNGDKAPPGYQLYTGPAEIQLIDGSWVRLGFGSALPIHPRMGEITTDHQEDMNALAGIIDGNPVMRIIRVNLLGLTGGVDENSPEYQNSKTISTGVDTGLAAFDAVSVYYALSKAGKVVYVGITNNLARRAVEHGSRFSIQAIPKLMRLSREDARAVEQALIYLHGLQRNGGTLLNRINSISTKNPIHNEAVSRGFEILRQIGYGGSP
jgi:hypothetical protein